MDHLGVESLVRSSLSDAADPDDKSLAVVAGQGQYEDDQDEKQQPDDQPDQTRPIHSQILDPPPT